VCGEMWGIVPLLGCRAAALLFHRAPVTPVRSLGRSCNTCPAPPPLLRYKTQPMPLWVQLTWVSIGVTFTAGTAWWFLWGKDKLAKAKTH
jgi:hypothetical protein